MDWNKQGRNQRSKREHKKCYLSKERAQAKRGRFGRGTYIGEDTFNYFLRIFEVKESDFPNAEEKEIFVDNVFEQTIGKELEISCNQFGSRVLEKFLPWASARILLQFSNAFSKDLKSVCLDEFGSHVIQQLLQVINIALQKTRSADINAEDNHSSQAIAPEIVEKLKDWFSQVCKCIGDNFQEFLWNRSANHIIRIMLQCLSGLQAESSSKANVCEIKDKMDSKEIDEPPIDEGKAIIEQCGHQILNETNILECVGSSLVSGFLQTLLLALNKIESKLTSEVIHYVLDKCFDCGEVKMEESNDNDIPEIFQIPAATRLMDVMITVSSRKSYTKIYNQCFINKLKSLSIARDANFCVQNLLKRCSDKNEFEVMFDELSSSFELLLCSQKHGVLLALGEACHRLSCKHIQFIKELQSALHCTEHERQNMFPLLLAHLVKYERWCNHREDNKMFILTTSLHGTLMLQILLKFPKTIKIVKAILNMDSKDLEQLLCDIRGSHVGDAFFASKSIGEKSKEKFCIKLKGSFVPLVISKHGSRVLDNIWAWASLKFRKLILEDLAPSESLIKGVQYGSIFAEKNGLSLFIRRPQDWEESQKRNVRNHKLFADIISLDI